MKYLNLILSLFVTISLFSQTNSEYQTPSKQQLDSLKTKLEIIFMKDQTFRRIYIEAENKLGKDSDAYEYFWEVVEAQDKVLEKEVTNIIDNYGWLGISQVGRLANGTQWSVLQHGSISSKEKYAPLLKASILKKESQPAHYARLIDRMLINSNKPQIYGTQIDYNSEKGPTFFPIEKPEYINQKRKEIGLEKIQSFAKKKGVEWNINQKEK
ncbi:hypothetical protein SAMN04487910_2448 [Aquimarina amphilecti]|uniref:Uncharacterized protein n=1 Tax=Aquimarina amphilecti TaxID=1038014 RepID=A0A1H7Q5X2_AQUAM|nr:DUF6624 domain-containing protein [Aquimarina amphilecti]SEL43561.1 hypothetical protein SAMN04487910_2448 [Aquimarina amphilecti]